MPAIICSKWHHMVTYFLSQTVMNLGLRQSLKIQLVGVKCNLSWALW
jgi:hypothetical protein